MRAAPPLEALLAAGADALCAELESLASFTLFVVLADSSMPASCPDASREARVILFDASETNPMDVDLSLHPSDKGLSPGTPSPWEPRLFLSL